MSNGLSKVGELNKTEKAAIIQQALQKEGFNDSQISKLMQVSRTRVYVLNKKIKAGTLNPLVAKAKRAVKELLQGRVIGDMREVRGSDVLTAAKMVLDRSDPIISKVESTNVSLTYDMKEEDRQRYKSALGIIDAEFTLVAPEKQKMIEEAPPPA